MDTDGEALKRQAIAEWAAFLESTPPNTPKVIANLAEYKATTGGQKHWEVARPRLNLHCEIDNGVRGFDVALPANTGAGAGMRGFDAALSANTLGYQFLTYRCRDCGRTRKTFSVLISYKDRENGIMEVMKLGEYPPFSAPISARIGKLLGEKDLELYRKGTRAEAQGLGIGAATYFRRIVDNQWQLLVKELREAALTLGVKDVSVYDAALAETHFSNAVKRLKDAIPGKLLILDGENPLTLLYQPLSVQLHGLTDEQCLQQAADIRLVLTAMLENIADVLKDQNELRDAANRLKQVRA